MNLSYPNAAEGLKMLLISQILSIVNVVLAFVAAAMLLASGSTLGLNLVRIVSIIALALTIYGLFKASTDDEGYRIPLYAAAASLVVTVLNFFLSNVPVIGTLLSIIITVLDFIVVNGVCQTSGNLLHSKGSEALVDRGNTVAKIYFICTVINVVCTVISIIPVLDVLGGLVSAVASIVLLVAYIMYLTFLSSGSKALV